MKYTKKGGEGKFLTKNTFDALIGEFHSYSSDDNKQDISKTAARIIDLINILVTNIIITQYISTIWEETNGCANQYICATVFASYQLYLFGSM